MAFDSLKARIPSPLLRIAARTISPVQHLSEFLGDAVRYMRVSSPRDGVVTAQSDPDHFEAQLTKDYHRVEKGLALPAPKRPFGAKVEARLRDVLPAAEAALPSDAPVLANARTALAALDLWNAEGAIDDDVSPIGERLAPQIDEATLTAFFETRRSIRNFVATPDVAERVARAAALARHTPSVCNRQAGRLHLYTAPAQVRDVLSHQNGNAGFRETVPAVAVVTVDSRLFTGVTERNQRFVDGGLFAMTFVWALHGVGLSTCMLNWSMNNRESNALRRAADIPEHEDIITMIAIGDKAPNARIARSPRRDVNEVLVNHTGGAA